MLQSLCVYGFMIFSFFTLLQTVTVVKKNGQRLTKTIPFYPIRYSIALLIFAFFSGVRWDVGIDYLTYLTEYLSIQQNGFTIREDFETGYIALQEMLLKMHVPFTSTSLSLRCYSLPFPQHISATHATYFLISAF